MAIIEKNHNKFFLGIDGKPESLIIQGIDIGKEQRALRDAGINSISIGKEYGFSLDNLKILREFTFVEDIRIFDEDLDLNELYVLTSLKRITLYNSNKIYMNLIKFPNLEFLNINWTPNITGWAECYSLKELLLGKFRPISKSFIDFNLPPNITYLEITESNIESLQGINSKSLSHFEAHYCSKLNSLVGIEDIKGTLLTLVLDYCRNLTLVSQIEKCNKLQKLILGDCGKIENLKWLKALKDLRHFSFYNTEVIDGDLSNCIGLEYISFKNKKHYSHTIEEIRGMNK